MKLSSGQSLVRKDGYNAKEYKRSTARMRFWSMFPYPFLERHQQEQRKGELTSLISDLQKTIADIKKAGTTDDDKLERQLERLQALQKRAS